MLARGVDLAVSSALALDAVRYTLRSGGRRQQWNSRFAVPAMRLAFRFAYRSGDAELVTDLIETQCAGTTFSLDVGETIGPGRQLPLDMFDIGEHVPGPEMDALALGSALADMAASKGVVVDLPPRLALAPDGRIVLADRIAAAEQRYGRLIRDSRVLPA
jgi:hypothetical protein